MKQLWNILSFLKTLFIFIFLSILTQVGGLIYIFTKLILRKYHLMKSWKRFPIYGFIYLISVLFIVPQLAQLTGRVALPIRGNELIKPQNSFTYLANRHYVKKEMKELILDIAQQVKQVNSSNKIIYLDANFPFIDGFPLLPHLSHDDGEKLDISFFYTDAKNGKRIHHSPSWLGYGICESPKKGEQNQIELCRKKGYWQYSLLENFSDQKLKAKYPFDEAANKKLLTMLAKDGRVGKIFIEPHLKVRLGLNQFDNIRYHGCRAVRHDDHIHIQL